MATCVWNIPIKNYYNLAIRLQSIMLGSFFETQCSIKRKAFYESPWEIASIMLMVSLHCLNTQSKNSCHKRLVYGHVWIWKTNLEKQKKLRQIISTFGSLFPFHFFTNFLNRASRCFSTRLSGRTFSWNQCMCSNTLHKSK